MCVESGKLERPIGDLMSYGDRLVLFGVLKHIHSGYIDSYEIFCSIFCEDLHICLYKENNRL